MEQSQPVRPGKLPCPVCKAEPRSRIWEELGNGEFGQFRIKSPKHKFLGTEPSALVCTVCGYVQFFVDPEDFRY